MMAFSYAYVPVRSYVYITSDGDSNNINIRCTLKLATHTPS